MTRPVPWTLAIAAAAIACSPISDPAGPPALHPDASADVSAAAPTLVRTYGNWKITMTDLGELVPNGGSSAYAINDLGEIVGTAIGAAGTQVRPIWVNNVVTGYLTGTTGTPYAWNNRRETVGRNVVNSKAACSVYWIPGLSSGQLPPLPGGRSCATYAYDVNASGEMSGGAESQMGTVLQHRPVTWKNGVNFRDLGLPPGARTATGAGINDAGDVVGNMTDATTGKIDAFVYRNGQYARLTPLTTNYATYAIDINNRGDIIGTSNGGVPVVWWAGSSTPTVLAIPAGHYYYQLWRINDNGDIIGTVNTPPPTNLVAALWRNGQYISLGTWTGGQESYARAINSAGTIVGVSSFSGTTWGLHAMTWTVVPIGGGTNTPPSVTLQATSPTTIPGGGTVSMQATFTDPDVGDGPWTYTWKWGNGPVTGAWASPGSYTASRKYIKAGATYNVVVIVTDKRGATSTSNPVLVTVQ